MFIRQVRSAATLALACGLAAAAQTAQTAPPRVSGTVKSVSPAGFTVTAASGPDVTVAVSGTTKIFLVDPTTKDVKAATAGTLADVAAGDKAIVTGTAGDAPTTLTAARVYLLKAAAIAQSHAAADAAWAQGLGGIVKTVNLGTTPGTIVLASGLKTITVTLTPATVVRRYSGSSVKFSDAVLSQAAQIRPGDQLRVRGTKSPDASAITADEMVAGTFRNYSGLLTAVDAAAGTVTLKDLTTKKTVTVAVAASSDVRRLPPMVAQMVAARMKGAAAGAPANAPGPAAGEPSGSARRAGGDLSSMLSRMPTETLTGLKPGEAVMIVATASADGASTAVTLLAGVDAILTASPSAGVTLSPWSMGGGGEGAGEGAGGGR